MKPFTRLAILLCTLAVASGCSTTTTGTPHPSTSAPAGSAKTNNAAPSMPPAPPSDETQIRESVKEFQDAYNTQNWDAYLEVMCAPMRAKFTPSVMDYLKKDRARSGATTANITKVTINGDTAIADFTASSEGLGSGRASMPMKHEDEGWKVCQLQ